MLPISLGFHGAKQLAISEKKNLIRKSHGVSTLMLPIDIEAISLNDTYTLER